MGWLSSYIVEMWNDIPQIPLMANSEVLEGYDGGCSGNDGRYYIYLVSFPNFLPGKNIHRRNKSFQTICFDHKDNQIVSSRNGKNFNISLTK